MRNQYKETSGKKLSSVSHNKAGSALWTPQGSVVKIKCLCVCVDTVNDNYQTVSLVTGTGC